MTEPAPFREHDDGPRITRESRWNEARRTLEHETDALGHHIEPGVLETVVGLNLLDIPSYQSCEGHADRGAPAPYVDVGPAQSKERFHGELVLRNRLVRERGLGDDWPAFLRRVRLAMHTTEAPELFEAADQIELAIADWADVHDVPEVQAYRQWMEVVQHARTATAALIEEFYSLQQPVDPVLRLNVRGNRLSTPSYLATLGQRKSDAERSVLLGQLDAAQDEMRRFGEFLRQKFLGA